ncbi:MAG: hypothetical protein A2085_01695 [Gemmatimonadetes bacterium GWC2_71_10]|nr:MAG: hypothetical protein A2085_01695 [Gemmatimonadetes bacterium GWC2_71_10]
MKVVLATLQEDVHCYGLRMLSAVLRRAGVETTLVFLGRQPRRWGVRRAAGTGEPRLPPPRAFEQLVELCRDADLVGLSVLTLHYRLSADLSAALRRRIHAPLVWGGIHPTVQPDESITHADIICRGEAEETLLEIVERLGAGRHLDGVAGTWERRDGSVIKNELRPPPADLDSLPDPDYSGAGHFVLEGGRLRPMTDALYLERTDGIYMTINARGCSLRCTYCCNSQYGRLFDWLRLRYRNADRIVDELAAAARRFPGLRGIKLSDDDFGDLSDEYIATFAAAYRARVGLPLGIPGFSPRNLTASKLDTLVGAGLEYVRLGIQSGSRAIRKLYGRPDTNQQILAAVNLVHRFDGRIRRFKIDMITDNPWESESDVLASVRLLMELPKPYVMTLFSLTLYPGTPLHTRAVREGLAQDGVEAGYRRHFYRFDQRNALNRILSLFRRRVVLPSRIERLVGAREHPWRFRWRYWWYQAEATLRTLTTPGWWRRTPAW